jgi:hypothetical protein
MGDDTIGDTYPTHPKVFVESLDRAFDNVCELDLVFHFDEVLVVSEILWYWKAHIDPSNLLLCASCVKNRCITSWQS